MKKNVSRNGLFGPRDKVSRLKNKEYYPLFFVVFALIGAIFVGLFIYFVAVPLLAKDFKTEDGPTYIKDDSPINNNVQEKSDLYDLVKENLFKIRYVNQPQMVGNELICTGGSDGAGNPLLSTIYLYTVKEDGSSEGKATDIKCVNDNIFYPQLSTDYIAYVDSRVGGGGSIYYFNRKTSQSKLIKDFYGAAPRIYLNQNRVIWFEQVAGNVSSIYVYDILLDKIQAVETQVDLPFVYGGIGVNGNRIVWADLIDTDYSGADLAVSNKSQLRILDLSTGAMDAYNPNMYTFSPQIYGNALCWLDTNNSPTASLHISIDKGEPKKIAASVSEYYLYDGVIAFCQNERMYAYFINRNLTLPITKEDKRAIMLGGANGYVFWNDITQTYERDIVKYAKVDSTSWQK